MVKIRLARGGAKSRPFYHVVVCDQRVRRDSCSIERIGFFNPVARGKEKRLELDLSKVAAWIAKGAQPSNKVRALVKEASRAAA